MEEIRCKINTGMLKGKGAEDASVKRGRMDKPGLLSLDAKKAGTERAREIIWQKKAVKIVEDVVTLLIHFNSIAWQCSSNSFSVEHNMVPLPTARACSTVQCPKQITDGFANGSTHILLVLVRFGFARRGTLSTMTRNDSLAFESQLTVLAR